MYTCFSFLIIILISTFPSTLSTCPSSSCSKSAPAVRFPFQLLPPNQPNTGYPGFNISCNSQALTILTLPNSPDFNVINIDYYHQLITLSDPQNCMPKRLMNLDLSNSPFHINTSYYINYTIISCPTHLVQSRYITIECLSNSTTSILATTSLNLAYSVSNSCTIINTVLIPTYQPYYINDQNTFSTELLTQDLRLNWNITDCVPCEGAGGFCGLSNHNELGCYINCQSSSGPSASEIRLFRLVILCFTITAVSFTVGIALYFWFIDHGRRESNWGLEEPHRLVYQARASYTNTNTMSSPNIGLDNDTIESYAKVVVGDSKRIPGPNDISCPICLTDYCPKDTLRTIPECKHCFHADCVDEWLRANPTCPLCRNSPVHAAT